MKQSELNEKTQYSIPMHSLILKHSISFTGSIITFSEVRNRSYIKLILILLAKLLSADISHPPLRLTSSKESQQTQGGCHCSLQQLP